MDATVEKGRWSSAEAARIYTKENDAVHNSFTLSENLLSYFNQFG